ncbi:hypothetical protein [Lapidilactobacillus gannanensis]|jgi:hypothetical protein|uniref:Uncharacterized protein n=1 Tax=Lapidilactobacillus gannanensis TaxID=2486002 RepID=A0ABW4BLH4_9LACO|nr:hypothetical protein [Lapidilactobacillus gannanensis]MCH4057091.1 hypothetical protein [Lactobacillaceae bacterium]
MSEQDLMTEFLRVGKVIKTELVLTSLRAACRGTRPTLIDANYRPKFKDTKIW